MGIAWSIPYNLSSLFITSYAEDLNLSRSAINMAFTLRAMGQLVVSLTAGFVFSKVKLHNLMKIASITLVISVFFQSRINTSLSLYLVTILSSLSSLYLTIIPLSIIMNNWFSDRLGLVIGLTFMGSGIGTFILSPLVGGWITQYGWRNTFVILAIIAGVTVIPIVFFILKLSPKDKGLKPYGKGKLIEDAAISKSGSSLRDLKKRGSFWLVLVSVSIMAFGASTLMQNTSPHLEGLNFSLQASAKVLSLSSIALAGGKLLLGILFDTKGVRIASIIASIGLILGLISLVFVTYTRLAILVIILGTGLGCSYFTVANQNITKNLYGTKDYTNILSFIQAATSIGSIISPYIVGLFFDKFRSYDLIFIIGAVIVAIAMIIFMVTLPKVNDEPYRKT